MLSTHGGTAASTNESKTFWVLVSLYKFCTYVANSFEQDSSTILFKMFNISKKQSKAAI